MTVLLALEAVIVTGFPYGEDDETLLGWPLALLILTAYFVATRAAVPASWKRWRPWVYAAVVTGIDFAGQEGRPGFQAQNRTVDGQFYLLDGPPGQKEWIRDTNSTQLKGTDFFNLDPRTLVGAVVPGSRDSQIALSLPVTHVLRTEA